jgi:hypothetical protein
MPSKTKGGARTVARNSLRPGFVRNELPIRGVLVGTQLGYLKVSQLRFYPDNPRVYSLVHSDDGEPSQEEIQAQLLQLDHVKQLIQDIKSHGGLLEPLVVRDGTMDVIEGNSRLAAYQFLRKVDPVMWGKVRCNVLPADISETLISAFLSQLHLKGKREWPPYEQAGHLHRRHRRDGLSIKEIASETGLAESMLSRTIEAFQLMLDEKDRKRERWSYYLEIVKPSAIRKIRKHNPGFVGTVIKKVQAGDIKTAQDLRKKLPVICRSSPATIEKFLDGRLKFEDAYEAACAVSAADPIISKLEAFRVWLARSEAQDSILKAKGAARKRARYEIGGIAELVTAMRTKLRA